MNLDWLLPLPFLIGALLAHFGVNFTDPNIDLEKEEK